LDDIHATLRTATERIEELQKERDQYRNKIFDMQREIAQKLTEGESIKTRLQGELDECNKEKERLTAELRKEVKANGAKVDKLGGLVQDVNNQVVAKEQEIARLVRDIEILTVSMQEMESDLQHQLDDCNREKEVLNTRLTTKHQELEDMRKGHLLEIEGYKIAHKDEKARITEELNRDIRELTRRANAKQTEIDRLNEEMQELAASSEAERSNHTRLLVEAGLNAQRQRDRLQAESDKQIEGIRGSLNDEIDRTSRLAEEREKLQGEYDLVSAKLKDYDRQRSLLRPGAAGSVADGIAAEMANFEDRIRELEALMPEPVLPKEERERLVMFFPEMRQEDIDDAMREEFLSSL
jgi:chromosome segregation ATPase